MIVLMPPDGAVMINAVDVFKSRSPSPGEPPVLYGMPVPAAINAVVGGVLPDGTTIEIQPGTYSEAIVISSTSHSFGCRIGILEPHA